MKTVTKMSACQVCGFTPPICTTCSDKECFEKINPWCIYNKCKSHCNNFQCSICNNYSTDDCFCMEDIEMVCPPCKDEECWDRLQRVVDGDHSATPFRIVKRVLKFYNVPKSIYNSGKKCLVYDKLRHIIETHRCEGGGPLGYGD